MGLKLFKWIIKHFSSYNTCFFLATTGTSAETENTYDEIMTETPF